jgi:hypothetical protein
MHLRLRFIGRALEDLNARGHDDRRLPVQVNPEVIHVGDLVRHPLFPGRNIYVVAREIDLVDRCVNVWLDELPGPSVDTESFTAGALPCSELAALPDAQGLGGRADQSEEQRGGVLRDRVS